MRAWATVLAIALGGCWNAVEEHCRRCTIVRDGVIRTTPELPSMPPLGDQTRVVLILVHGAFGFGHEWDAVVKAAQARPEVALVAFAWPGPWTRKPSLPAEALRALVQEAIDGAPPGAEVLVIGHSAGGALAKYAAEHVRVGVVGGSGGSVGVGGSGVGGGVVDAAARRVRVVSVAAPANMNLAPFVPERAVNTPLGMAIGGKQAPPGPIAAGVDFTAYATEDAPARPPPPEPRLRRVWLGAHAGHQRSLALAALPLLRP
jgi:pimeloyl-ACP methyl ester carboxylesterase